MQLLQCNEEVPVDADVAEAVLRDRPVLVEAEISVDSLAHDPDALNLRLPI